ncbi:mitochondrial distribution and morphology protein 35 [Saitoella complicata NRRL Y-17804]|uniref:mitochondrial distribution and morphology protein 35 n=1 Tax=Saitoella complicata (strain BCRC 22490 / CBS 7301 / JCM 7358 / NBRC 10748 / NRRL Y-17804) TaxID=698492 RepID=UPI0008681465|nr:mitochondrial distribution and morphology protein 35 [Saitoella complicata NRRL Y-17804]ODQ53512.1 mitochondrial distribution and morphology protein 35 [Saitoella complicata NRRL Y-17804]
MSASVGPDCTELKQKYDSCFNDWYANKFLKGVATVNECEDTFVDYKACVMVTLKEKKIDVMLDEARKEAPFEKGGKFNSGM